MTLGQFFLGLVTLLVATIVYRWQKSIDRKTVTLTDLRAALSKYAALSHSLFLKQPYAGEENSDEKLNDFFAISDAEIELYTLRDHIDFTAPDIIVEAVLDCDSAFRAWKIAFTRSSDLSVDEKAAIQSAATDFKFKHERMLLTFRAEFESHTKFAGQDYIENFLGRMFGLNRK